MCVHIYYFTQMTFIISSIHLSIILKNYLSPILYQGYLKNSIKSKFNKNS